MNLHVFIVLHFKSANDTKNCLHSILTNLPHDNLKIVIVDNGSCDGSIDIIKKEYPESLKIHYVVSDVNLGFAKGNNLGFSYAKEKLKPLFITVINNDIIMTHSNFCDIIEREYRLYSFDIFGCDVRTANGNLSNPIGPEYQSLKDLNKTIKKRKRQYFLCRLGFEPWVVLNKKMLKFLFSYTQQHNKVCEKGELKKFQLHGCCLTFGSNYIQNYEGFMPITFLYEEESVLRYICDRDHLAMVYSPTTEVLHNEQRATKSEYRSIRRRHMFYYKNSLESLSNLKKYILEQDSMCWK